METKLIPNSTQIPNIILDFIVPQLPEAEARCLLYISRRTYGFHKEKDRISFSQFIKGIKNKENERLDYGAGLARASVSEALSNLRKSNLVLVEKTTKGNYYSINLDLFGDKEWKSQIKQVVRKVNRFRKQTRIGLLSRPKQVHLLNLQKKGNKGNKVISVSKADDRPFSFKTYLTVLIGEKRKDLHIIGLYWEYKGFMFANKLQCSSAIKRELRPAKALVGYSNENIITTMEWLTRNANFKWVLETVHKYIDENLGDLDAKLRLSKGDWKCQFGHWHPQYEKCGHTNLVNKKVLI